MTVAFVADIASFEKNKVLALALGTSSDPDSYMMIQRMANHIPNVFGDIHFECEGQGNSGYDVIEEVMLTASLLTVRLKEQASRDFDGRLNYRITLALSPKDLDLVRSGLKEIFKGTELLKEQ